MPVNDRFKGMTAMVLAGVTWGLSAIFYKQLSHVPALEVASHRVLWAFLTFAAILAAQGRGYEIFRILTITRESQRHTVVAAAMIAVNWFVWILAIQLGHATEASLGYFIFPLIAVFLGSVVFNERLTAMQWAAVAIAAAGVVYLTVGLQAAPWIAISLAVTFAIYGVIKKKAAAGPVVTVAAEAGLITPFAIVWLVGVHQFGWTGATARPGGMFGKDLLDSLMLACSGVITAGPLILMSYATKRLRYTEVGLLQYTNPTLQFAVAVLIFMEPFGPVQLVSFSLIWAALILYSIELVRQDRIFRRAEIAAKGESTTVNNAFTSGSANPVSTTVSTSPAKPSQ